MADEIITEQQTELSVPEMMAIALNGGIAPQAQETQIETGTQQAAVETEVETQVFSFDALKEKFSYEKPEDVFAEIEELRNLKANPVTVREEIKYENEQSEKLAKALQAGKVDEVYAFLDEQRRLDRFTTAEVTDETAGDIIKLGMQLQYKDLTAAEIDYKFKKQFSIPKEPVILATEEEEDFEIRKAEWQAVVDDIKMNKIIEAKLMKPKLEESKQKLVLPEIGTSVDEGYLQYKQMLEENQRVDAETKDAYKAVLPKAIETKIPFIDEANKINFEFQFEPDSASFEQARDIVSDISLFNAAFANADGTHNRQKFLDAIYFGLNKEKALTAAMTQAKNATIKALLPDNSGFNRQIPQGQEMSELDKNMQAALQPFIRQGRTV